MKAKLSVVARYLLGLIFLVFGANGLAMFTIGKGFIPMPPPSAEMAPIFGGFMAMVYLLPLVKIIEVVSGILLLTGKRVTLALVLLGPVVVNIFALHLFVGREGLPMAIVIALCWGFLVKERWAKFKPLLS